MQECLVLGLRWGAQRVLTVFLGVRHCVYHAWVPLGLLGNTVGTQGLC